MAASWKVTILTLFPDMFPGPLGQSLSGKALKEGKWELNILDIRDFTEDVHHTVDDMPYGGGAGMVMKPDILGKAIESIDYDAIYYMSPRGTVLQQSITPSLLEYQHIAILCGRYEGIDQRLIDHYGIKEISLGDFVLSGGEIPAMALIDACVRQIDGVVSNPKTLEEESFAEGNYCNLLEYPLYTRPRRWKEMDVPDVLLSGNHKKIDDWRLECSQKITKARRPDLWQRYQNDEE